MQKYLKVFFVLFIIVPKCSQSLDLNVDQNRVAENAEILRKLEWEIEQEEKQMNIEKTKRDYKDFISNLKNKLTDCEAQTIKQSNSTLSNILSEIQNIKSNAQNNESNFKIKDEIIANLTAQLANQSTTLNNKINQLIDVEIVDLKKQIENKNIEINNLKSNNLSAEFKLKEYEYQIIRLESNISSYKNSIDKKDAEISNQIKQNKLQKNQSEDLKISLQANLKTCTNQLTKCQQEKTSFNSQLQEKIKIISERENQLKKCHSDHSNSEILIKIRDLQNLGESCKSDLKELQTKTAQNDVNIISLRKTAGDTQKKLDHCEFENAANTKINEHKDIALQESDNKWIISQQSLSDCQKNLNDAIQDILDAKLKLKACTANQEHFYWIDKELKECRDKESANQKSLPNTCPSSTVGPQEIKLDNYEPFEVPCEYGWIVIQQRSFGYVNFNQNFVAYEAGFGDWQSDFFLGLKKLHLITNSQHYELKIRFVNLYNQEITAEYDNFKIGNNQTGYKLGSLGNYKGKLFDAMRSNENMKFSTFDKNFGPKYNCAELQLGGWWFSTYCGDSNLNAQYNYNIRWYNNDVINEWNSYYSYIYMMIRPSPKVT